MQAKQNKTKRESESDDPGISANFQQTLKPKLECCHHKYL
jgi:hypothetical protein